MKRIILICFSFCLLSTNIIFPQVYGKIFTKNEADSIYGPVIKSVSISTPELRSYLKKTNNHLLFNLMDDQLVLLDNKRNGIYPSEITISDDIVFRVVSLTVIEELLNEGQNSKTYFEKRKSVLSITNGDFTLEFTGYCPPFCN